VRIDAGLALEGLGADSMRDNRLKDIEWVEKRLDALKKILRNATGTANLADKAKKEEMVRPRPSPSPTRR
jgi:hypothetical protein